MKALTSLASALSIILIGGLLLRSEPFYWNGSALMPHTQAAIGLTLVTVGISAVFIISRTWISISAAQSREAAIPLGMLPFVFCLILHHPINENPISYGSILWTMLCAGFVMVFFGLVMPLVISLDTEAD